MSSSFFCMKAMFFNEMNFGWMLNFVWSILMLNSLSNGFMITNCTLKLSSPFCWWQRRRRMSKTWHVMTCANSIAWLIWLMTICANSIAWLIWLVMTYMTCDDLCQFDSMTYMNCKNLSYMHCKTIWEYCKFLYWLIIWNHALHLYHENHVKNSYLLSK